ncbi:hypothetical protein [Streptosporangium subroseum]|uniref:hypothetical protein n=1 Tax=Streptosporangium subroseum TaxID=106412 RepID=UPI00308A1B34|nr:hypothetical protein OHB15_25325 [Streptosporangium subroseum]
MENYAKLRKPLDARRFTGELVEEMDAELSALHDALPGLPWLRIVERKEGGAILLTPQGQPPRPDQYWPYATEHVSDFAKDPAEADEDLTGRPRYARAYLVTASLTAGRDYRFKSVAVFPGTHADTE